MIYLYILKPDGSLYWKEQFNSAQDAEKWLNEEKKRPYWKDNFTHTIIEGAHESEISVVNGAVVVDEQKKQERISAEQQAESEHQQDKEEKVNIKNLMKGNLDTNDIKRILAYLIKQSK